MHKISAANEEGTADLVVAEAVGAQSEYINLLPVLLVRVALLEGRHLMFEGVAVPKVVVVVDACHALRRWRQRQRWHAAAAPVAVDRRELLAADVHLRAVSLRHGEVGLISSLSLRFSGLSLICLF